MGKKTAKELKAELATEIKTIDFVGNAIHVECSGIIVPKARARVRKNGHSYMPPRYNAWKEGAISAYKAIAMIKDAPIECFELELCLYGKHSRGGDSDNTCGAVLDALKQAGVVREDNFKHCPYSGCRLVHSKEPPTYIAKILILDNG